MTDEGPAAGQGPRPGDDDDRAARLAALLRVDISASDSDAPAPADDAPAVPAADDGAQPSAAVATAREAPRSSWAPASSRRASAIAGAILVALLLGGAGLAYAGTRIVRSSTAGEVLAPIDDPTAPGFEAVVDPTPTLVVMHDVDGLIDGITVLTLPDPQGVGGGVVFVPTRTVADNELFGESPLEIAYDLATPEFQADSVGRLLNAAMLERTVVDAARWADLVAPVAPLSIDNPNELVVDGEVRFAAGEIELAAEDVGPYLEATVEDESDLARLFRHQVFWNAWLDAVGDAGTVDAVPGEVETGIGRFVRTLAGGPTEVVTLPVQPAAEGAFGDAPAFEPRVDQMQSLVARLIPLPVSPYPGARARTRVLNGTPETMQAPSVAATLAPAGVEVTFVGNASTYDVEETTVAVFGAEFQDEAEAIVDILGVGVVVEDERPSDSADITVTLGADYG